MDGEPDGLRPLSAAALRGGRRSWSRASRPDDEDDAVLEFGEAGSTARPAWCACFSSRWDQVRSPLSLSLSSFRDPSSVPSLPRSFARSLVRLLNPKLTPLRLGWSLTDRLSLPRSSPSFLFSGSAALLPVRLARGRRGRGRRRRAGPPLPAGEHAPVAARQHPPRPRGREPTHRRPLAVGAHAERVRRTDRRSRLLRRRRIRVPARLGPRARTLPPCPGRREPLRPPAPARSRPDPRVRRRSPRGRATQNVRPTPAPVSSPRTRRRRRTRRGKGRRTRRRARRSSPSSSFGRDSDAHSDAVGHRLGNADCGAHASTLFVPNAFAHSRANGGGRPPPVSSPGAPRALDRRRRTAVRGRTASRRTTRQRAWIHTRRTVVDGGALSWLRIRVCVSASVRLDGA